MHCHVSARSALVSQFLVLGRLAEFQVPHQLGQLLLDIGVLASRATVPYQVDFETPRHLLVDHRGERSSCRSVAAFECDSYPALGRAIRNAS